MAHPRLHPLPLYFLSDFCRRNQMSLAWLLDCMDPDGRESIPQGTAAEIELMSKGEVPIACWPRLRKIVLAGEAAVATKEKGRPPHDPTHPVYAYLRVAGGTLASLGAEVQRPPLDHQRITHYVRGRRAIPLSLAREFQKVSKGRIPWRCWALVRDEKNGVFFTYGKRVKRDQVRTLQKQLKQPVSS